MAPPKVQADVGIAERIAEALRLRGWTQAQLAESAHMGQSYLSMLLNGERKEPSIRVVTRLADALGVSVDWLARGAKAGDLEPDEQQLLRDYRAIKRAHLRRMARELVEAQRGLDVELDQAPLEGTRSNNHH